MGTNLFKSILNYWKSILWILVICTLLFIPGDKLPEQKIFDIPGFDKIIHFSLFLVFEWLLLYDASVKKVLDRLVEIAKINALTLSFAVSTELIQRYLVSERSGNIDDLLIDIIGLFAGVLSYNIFYRVITRFFPRIS